MSSALLTKIKDDIKAAMKAHDSETLGTLRTLHSKQEAIDILTKGGFLDKVPAEEAIIALYRKYMPAEMTEDEVKALIAEIKAATGASSPKDMGKIMKELSPKVKGRFDAKRASALVQEALK